MSITIGVNTAPLAGKDGRQADRAPDQGQARPGARRKRLTARARHRAPRRLGGAGPRRAAARGARRDDAPRGLRADGRAAERCLNARSTASAASRSSACRSTCPRSTSGSVTQLLAVRKGRMEHMTNHGTGWVRMDYLVPARGLIGFRTEFLTETRGTGIMHHVFERWEPWAGELSTRTNGSLVADRRRDHGDLLADEPAGARHAVRRAGRGGL